jgi:hypothetical protein
MIANSADIELDTGPRARELERMCVATRTVRPVAELIRFVIGPDGEAVPDLKSKLPGRGVWVTATQDALDDAIKRKAFSRGFKRDVRLPADLVARTDRLLEAAALDALAMAGKASLVVAGFAKVEAAVEHDAVIALLRAKEASPEGVKKLDSALRRRQPGRSVAVIGILTSAQLDLALGRPNVIHAALLAGPASGTFLARCQRLERFRASDQSHPAGAVPSRRTGQGH